MKIIKYNLCNRVNHGTEDEPVYEDVLLPVEIHCAAADLAANEEIAKAEAYKGEYTIEDDGQPEPKSTPSQLDVIEAQVTYTAMMTDTLLEV